MGHDLQESGPQERRSLIIQRKQGAFQHWSNVINVPAGSEISLHISSTDDMPLVHLLAIRYMITLMSCDTSNATYKQNQSLLPRGTASTTLMSATRLFRGAFLHLANTARQKRMRVPLAMTLHASRKDMGLFLT